MHGYTTTYSQLPSIRSSQALTPSSPLDWFKLAWGDAYASPMTSLVLGIAFTALCVLAYAAASAMPVLTTAPLTVLLMVGPYLATAGYFVARQRELGEPASLRSALSRVRTRALSISLFSLMMGLIAAAWVRLCNHCVCAQVRRGRREHTRWVPGASFATWRACRSGISACRGSVAGWVFVCCQCDLTTDDRRPKLRADRRNPLQPTHSARTHGHHVRVDDPTGGGDRRGTCLQPRADASCLSTVGLCDVARLSTGFGCIE